MSAIVRRGKFEYRDMDEQRGSPQERKGKTSPVVSRQGMPRVASSPYKQGQGRKVFSRVFPGSIALLTD